MLSHTGVAFGTGPVTTTRYAAWSAPRRGSLTCQPNWTSVTANPMGSRKPSTVSAWGAPRVAGTGAAATGAGAATSALTQQAPAAAHAPSRFHAVPTARP